MSGVVTPGRRSSGLVRWIWRTLTSMRTAIMLLALLAAAAIPGSLLPQRNVASDPNGVAGFAAEFPTAYRILDPLGFFNVYGSAWFAAVYLLLLVSMTGCVVPRCIRLWRASRAEPVAAPSNLDRFDARARLDLPADADRRAVVDTAATALRDRGFRVATSENEVRAERGYLREFGNVVFHLSLLVLLVGIGTGKLLGFEGRVVVVEGSSFANVRSAYDVFTPSALTNVDALEPFSFTLDDLEAKFATTGNRIGEPRFFNAALNVTSEEKTWQADVRPNQPLVVGGTKVFLTGNGYAPQVTVRDGRGRVAYSGPVVFLPLDGNLTSEGVVKVPDARPAELGFQGFFLPTARMGQNGPTSAFPDTLDPRLVLTAYSGDLGLGAGGTPQSVYALDTTNLTQLKRADGAPFAVSLRVGQTVKLPDGLGSITLDGAVRFANFQIAYDPGKEISLAAGILLLGGLVLTLTARRRRLWVRVTDGRVDIAGQTLTRLPVPETDLDAVISALGRLGATRPDPDDASRLVTRGARP